MALNRLAQIGFELDSLTSGVEITTHGFTGSVLSVLTTSVVHTGTYAQSWTATTQRGTDDYQFSAGTGTAYIQGWFYFTGYPNGNCTLLEGGDAAASIGGIYMNSSGQLGTAYFSSGAFVYDTIVTSAVSLNVWHYLEVECVTTSSNAQTIVTRLDGTQISSKAGTQTFAANAQNLVVWGAFCLSSDNAGAGTGTIATFYVDDIIVDGDGYPGGASLLRVTPNATGDSNGFLVNVGGTAGSSNNYTRVDEVTPDNATSYNASNVLNASDLFRVGASGLSSVTINCVSVGGVVANITGVDATTAIELQAEQTSGGTIQKSSSIIPDTTTWSTNGKSAPHNYPLIMYTDPTGATWTPTTLGSMQIGYTLDASHTDAVGVTTLWAYVDYTPVAVTTLPPGLEIITRQAVNRAGTY